jgi:hypothetical protein
VQRQSHFDAFEQRAPGLRRGVRRAQALKGHVGNVNLGQKLLLLRQAALDGCLVWRSGQQKLVCELCSVGQAISSS